MKCAKCGAQNREGAKFCNECAAPIEVSCPRCGSKNKPAARFCDECGTSLGTSAAASPKKPNDSSNRVIDSAIAENLDGERKTVTALFADIKGSMELMEDLDPEEARAIVDPVLKLMIDAVDRYGGYIVETASLRCLGRHSRMKTIPNADSTGRCECRKRCGAMAIACGHEDKLRFRCGSG
jgi:double zinc ribbon protein